MSTSTLVVPLAEPLPSVLAVGAWLKNTVCLIQKAQAQLSPCLGDLNNAEACIAHETAVNEFLQKSATSSPVAAVAHDLHPDFYSTRHALQLAKRMDIPSVAVQHHHAHIAAVCAEHGINEPVLGLALDGVGLGADHTAWGGELLRVERNDFERLGHFIPIPLAGGDHAAREPWRMAAGVMHLLGRNADIELRFSREPAAITVSRMLERGIHVPASSGAGRLFDAAAAVLGICTRMEYDAQAPILLERAATQYIHAHGWPEAKAEHWQLGSDRQLNLLPLFSVLLEETVPQRGAAYFHAALAAALTQWVIEAHRTTGISRIVFGGGCFANSLLADRLQQNLTDENFTVFQAERLPPGDAAIALGQAWVAAHRLAREEH
ncbi:MAG: carbamoyltransferase HypF [Pseudomonadota bacterium]